MGEFEGIRRASDIDSTVLHKLTHLERLVNPYNRDDDDDDG